MPDYYIRTPDQNKSRGPFDPMRLQTLGEAGQITENSLYYDETKEEWIPIAMNAELCAQVFPKREGLKLQLQQEKKVIEKTTEDEESFSVADMLDAAEGNTSQRKSIKQRQLSLSFIAVISPPALGVMMMASASFLMHPHVDAVRLIVEGGQYQSIINYPFMVLGMLDFILGLSLFLIATETYPLVRTRAMLTLGFGLYVGWSLGDPGLMLLCSASGVGIFVTTMSRHLTIAAAAIVLGLASNGYLAYLAATGRFEGFFEDVVFKLVAS
ncbi:MAG: hypothetical protein ACSHYA_03515 [Opitutaceae bacterium]